MCLSFDTPPLFLIVISIFSHKGENTSLSEHTGTAYFIAIYCKDNKKRLNSKRN